MTSRARGCHAHPARPAGCQELAVCLDSPGHSCPHPKLTQLYRPRARNALYEVALVRDLCCTRGRALWAGSGVNLGEPYFSTCFNDPWFQTKWAKQEPAGVLLGPRPNPVSAELGVQRQEFESHHCWCLGACH